MNTIAPGVWILLALSFLCTVLAYVFIPRWLALALSCQADQRQGTLTGIKLAQLRKRIVFYLLPPALPALFFTAIALFYLPPEPPSSLLLEILVAGPIACALALSILLMYVVIVTVRLASLVPSYLFILPEHADQVSFNACKEGIIDAARSFPQSPFRDDEEMEGFLRANIVLSRMRRYPPRQGRSQLSNDFAAYCRLTINGYRLGYHRFFQECLDAPDHLEAVRKELQDPSRRTWLLSRSFNGRAQAYLNEKKKQEEEG
jgi:hypothetical protein